MNVSIAALTVGCGLFATDQTANHPDGSPQSRYAVDAAGERNGPYTLWHPGGGAGKTGSIAEVGIYRQGKRTGQLTRTSTAGALVAEEQWFDGRLIAPRSERIITARLAEIAAEAKATAAAFTPGPGHDAPSKADLESTLYRVNGHRYLCGLPDDVGLKSEYVHFAQRGAALCARIGHLDHTPKNPGMPEDEFKVGYKGTSNSNLAQGLTGGKAVDIYMFDSDVSNRDRVGHRRWVLWPDQWQVGTGTSGAFSALFVMGNARKPKFVVDSFCYPPRGIVPKGWFTPGSAWSWHPASAKVLGKNSTATIAIYRYDLVTYQRAKTPLQNIFANVDTQGFGHRPAVIAIPELGAPKRGEAFEAVVTGLPEPAAAPGSAELSWITIFL